MKLLATYHIVADLKVLTGLHIGSGEQGMTIGGVDNPVIKASDGYPYIPGSSLKGKIRSELEWALGNVKKACDEIIESYNNKHKDEGKTFETLPPSEKIKRLSKVGPCTCGDCEVCKLFGHTNTDKKRQMRTIFRDAYLKDKSAFTETEIKSENTISRITAEANPRQFERVPAGTEFVFRMLFKKYENKDIDLLKYIFQGMMLLEDSFLGGGGSRGNGQVEFANITLKKREPLTTQLIPIDVGFNKVEDLFKNFESFKSKL